MKIRKLFKYENAHIVRNCTSERCSHSIHGHSYIIEVVLKGNKLDNGMMIYDFGLMKGTIKDIIDSFDHAITVWNKDEELVNVAKNYSDRHIILPMSSSAEAQSILLFKIIKEILKHTEMNNGEGKVKVHKVRVHETATGWAEAKKKDLELIDFDLKDIIFSNQIKSEWKDPEMWDKLLSAIETGEKIFKNPVIPQQV